MLQSTSEMDTGKSPNGSHLRELRESIGMSREKVASALSMSSRTIARMELSGKGYHARRYEEFLQRRAGKKETDSRSHASEDRDGARSRLEATDRTRSSWRFRHLYDKATPEQRSLAERVFFDAMQELSPDYDDADLLMEVATSLAARTLSRMVDDDSERRGSGEEGSETQSSSGRNSEE